MGYTKPRYTASRKKKEESNWLQSALNWCAGAPIGPSDIHDLATVIQNGRVIAKAERNSRKIILQMFGSVEGKKKLKEIDRITRRQMIAKFGLLRYISSCAWLR